MGGSTGVGALGISARLGTATVTDSETGDCDGDGVPGDMDGDFDVGLGGAFFGHGPWAEHCGNHREAAGTVTVSDFVFGNTVAFATGSNDANSWIADPVTGENTCVTDGLISPATDADDCLSPTGTGTQPVVCPGGGDGGLWAILYHDWHGGPPRSESGGLAGSDHTMGTVTSP
ncbi:MAG TPA: hypothetical protein VNX21_02460, partial [Candidatus Thermoplasmatota archaeon]|nr:hypothetical protein [Candidatus Thermoplasmatota archaeon]